MAGLARQTKAALPASSRVVAMDWSGAQNLLALGVVLLALPERERYTSLVVEPALPAATLDLGLRSEPNLELVMQLEPSLVLIGDELAGLSERIESVAPVEIFSADAFNGSNPLLTGDAALRGLADRLDRRDGYKTFRDTFDREVERAGARLQAYDGRPLFVATVIDGRRLLVFGKNSLFQSVLDHFGIVNAWTGYTTPYGHVTVTADRLAERKDARLLCIGDSSAVTLQKLLASPVVASLPFVRENRVVRIPDVLFYGGLPPALRFARLASSALVSRS